jgi:hypothetical protein
VHQLNLLSNPHLNKTLLFISIFCHPSSMENNLLIADEIAQIPEIDYEADNVLELQRQGALAVNQLIESYIKTGQVLDTQLIALVLVRFKDLQVRDYAMGVATAQNQDQLFNLWYWLLNTAPSGYIAPVSCIFAACAYESAEGAMAESALELAIKDCPNYPLALLLRRVFRASWPSSSFAAMRGELHPRICATLFGGSI